MLYNCVLFTGIGHVSETTVVHCETQLQVGENLNKIISRDIEPILVRCWASVADGSTTSTSTESIVSYNFKMTTVVPQLNA